MLPHALNPAPLTPSEVSQATPLGLLPPWLMRAVSRLLLLILTVQPGLTLAQVTVAPGSPTTTIKHTGNGVPVINIAAPNGNGLSHNQFSTYNVGPEGLILNNATARIQPTTLGGWINGNPNLRGGSAAQVILNEVTGSGRSFLRGYTEVAGQPAHVILANPHGITCDGCGFLNTPRATLTTGQIIYEQGRPRYDVRGGDILIEGAGLNASNIDRLELITRSARISAELYAQELDLITGVNRVDADTLSFTASDPNTPNTLSAAPKWAVDSSELGGMYVNAVRLIASERGVGVRLGGNLAARSGDIKIDAQGQLHIERDVGALAGNVHITLPGGAALTMAPNGQLFAADTLRLNLPELDIAPGETLTAWARRIDIAGTLTNRGELKLNGSLEVAHLNNQGTLDGNSLLQIKADTLTNSGQLIADYIALTVAGTLSNSGQIEGRHWLYARAGGDILLEGTDRKRGRLTSGSADTAGDILLLAGGKLLIGHTDLLTHPGPAGHPPVSEGLGGTGRILLSAAGDITLSDTATLHAGTDLIGLAGGQLTVQGTKNSLRAGGDLLLVSGGPLSLPTDTLSAGQHLGLIAAGELNLKANQLSAGDGLLLGAGQTELTRQWLEAFNKLTDTLGEGEFIDGRAGEGLVQALHALLTPPKTEADPAPHGGAPSVPAAPAPAHALTLNIGELATGGNVVLLASGDIQLTGQLAKIGGDLTTTGHHLTLAGFERGLNIDGTWQGQAKGDLSIGEHVTAHAGNILLTSAGAFSQRGRIESDGFLQISADAFSNSGQLTGDYTALEIAGSLANSGRLEGRHWLFAHAGGDIVLDGSGPNRGLLTSGSAGSAGDIVLLAGGELRFGNTDILTHDAPATPDAPDAEIVTQPALLYPEEQGSGIRDQITPDIAADPADTPIGDTGRILFYAAGGVTLSDSARLHASTDLIGLTEQSLFLPHQTRLEVGRDLLLVSGGDMTVEPGSTLNVGRNLGLVAAGDLTLKANEYQTSTHREETWRDLPEPGGFPLSAAQLSKLAGKLADNQPEHSTTETTTRITHDGSAQLTAVGGILLGAGQGELTRQLLDGLAEITGSQDGSKFIDGHAGKEFIKALNTLLNPEKPKEEVVFPDPGGLDPTPAPTPSGNLTLEAGHLQAGGNVVLRSGGDVNILALVDTDSERFSEIIERPGSRYLEQPAQTQWNVRDNQRQSIQRFSAQIGGDLTVYGVGDVTLAGVDLAVGGDISLTSLRHLDIGGVSLLNVEHTDSGLINTEEAQTALALANLQDALSAGAGRLAGPHLTQKPELAPALLAGDPRVTDTRLEGERSATDTLTWIGSRLAAGGDLKLTAGGFVGVTGSDLAGRRISLTGSVIQVSGTSQGSVARTTTFQQESPQAFSLVPDPELGPAYQVNTDTTHIVEQWLDSHLTAQGPITLKTHALPEGTVKGRSGEDTYSPLGDINLIGTQLTAGHIALEVSGNVNLYAGQSSDSTEVTRVSTASGHPKTSLLQSLNNLTHTVSVLEAGTLTGNVQGDVTLYGVQINADVGSKKTPFSVGGDWLHMAVVDQEQTPSEVSNSALKQPFGAGGGQIDTHQTLVAVGITGSTHLTVGGDATFGGTDYRAPGAGGFIHIETGGQLNIAPVVLYEQTHRGYVSKHDTRRDTFSATNAVARFSADQDLTLHAQGDFIAHGGEFSSAHGNVLLSSDQTLVLLPVIDTLDISRDTKSHTYTDGRDTVRKIQVNAPEGTATLHAGGDIILSSTDLQTRPGTGTKPPRLVFEHGGTLWLKDVYDETRHSKYSEHDSVVWTHIVSKGWTKNDPIDNRIGEGVAIEWGTGPIHVQYGVHNILSRLQGGQGNNAEEAIASLNQGWARDLAANWSGGKLVWEGKYSQYDDWDHGYDGLSEFGAGVVGIVVSVVTYGAASQYMAGLYAAVVAAVASSIVVQELTTHEINWNQVFKAAVVAAVTVGLTQGQFFGGKSLDGMVNFTGGAGLTFSSEQILGLLGRAVVNAGVNSLVYHTDFGQGMLGSIINDLASLAATSIARRWGDENLTQVSLERSVDIPKISGIAYDTVPNPHYNPGMQIVMHGVLGGLVAAALDRDIVAGAMGGMVEAIIANVIHAEFPDLDESLHNPGNWGARTAYQAGSMLISGFLAHEMGLDPAVAGSAALNAAANNFLSDPDDVQRKKLRDAGVAFKGLGLEWWNTTAIQGAASDLVKLDVWDQTSDYYMWRYQNDLPLNASQRKNLDWFVERYVAGQVLATGGSPDAIRANLYATPAPSPYENYLYASADDARNLFMDNYRTDYLNAHPWGIDGVLGLVFWDSRPTPTRNEEIFDYANFTSGHHSFFYDNLLPAQQDAIRVTNTIDTIAGGPVGSVAFLVGHTLGADEASMGTLLQLGRAGDGLLMSVGGAVVGRAGVSDLNQLFGGRTGSPLTGTSPYVTAVGGPALNFRAPFATTGGYGSYSSSYNPSYSAYGIGVTGAGYSVAGASGLRFSQFGSGVGVSLFGAEEAVTVFRVQGGTPPLAGRALIAIDANGNPQIQNTTLNVSIGDIQHARYFLSNRPGAAITSFEIPKWLDDFIRNEAIAQDGYRSNPLNQGGQAPKIVDPTTPGRSYELPPIWSQWLQEYAIPGSGKVR